ncbi:MAG: S8 family serine peptidase [Ilumatobacteraceae bacterium]
MAARSSPGVPRRMRALVAAALGATSLLVVVPVSPASASAARWLVMRTDGSTYTTELSASQADDLRNSAGIRFVEADTPVDLGDGALSTADSVAGLEAPDGADAGDVVPGRFIVSFRNASSARVASRNVGNGLIAAFSSAIDGFVADLDPAEYESLSSNPDVLAIEPDRVVELDVDQSGATWGLDRIDQRALPLNSTYSYTGDGTGVTAYVIDTGINAAHEQLAGRVRSGFTAVNDGRGSGDCNGHGTHVAGTIGGTTHGVAKNVNLVSARVFGCSGGATWSSIISAVDWVIRDHEAGTPAVANMSLGGGASAIVNSALARGAADGITFVVAAGNSGADACSYSPASEPTAITVGATGSNDTRAWFSNWGSCVDLFAPGVSITSAWWNSPVSLNTISGTSMASPHVAGVAALYLQQNPAAAPAAVQTAVVSAATRGAVTDAGTGSPNRLVYMASFEPAPPSVPSSPGTPVPTALDASVSLVWSAPSFDGGTPVTDYLVEYAPVTATVIGAWVTFDDGVSTNRTATVTGLANGTQYRFRVSAVNSVGTGLPGASAAATPMVPGVPLAPRSLVAYAGRASASLYWSSPLSNGTTLPVTDYVVEYRNPGGDWTVHNDGVSASRSAFLTGLTGNLVHTFRVSAVNSVGTGLPSNEYTVTPTSYTAPSAPRNLSASPRLLGAYVAWSTPADSGGGAISGYLVDWTVDSGVTWSPTVRTESWQRAVSLTGLTAGTVHTVRVRAVSEHGTGDAASTSVTPTAPTAPAAPRLSYVSPGYNTLSVYWSAPSSNGGSAVTGYVVEHSTNGGGTWARSSVAANIRMLQLTGLTGGTVHSVRVRAVNAVGESLPSSAQTVTPWAIAAPSAPRYANAWLSGTTGIVTWNSPVTTNGSPLTGYEVWQSTDGVTFSRIATTLPSVRYHYARSLANDTTYRFHVRAVNAIGASSPSNVASVTVRVAGAPSVPTGLTASVDGNAVNLTWTASTAAATAPVTDYVVEYASGGGAFTVWNDGYGTGTTARVSGLASDVQVALRVKARNRLGDSAWSATVTATPRFEITVPAAPLNVSALAGDSRVGVSWSDPDNDGGADIVSFTATARVNGAVAGTCTSAGYSCIIPSLANGVEHSVTVTATNSVGTGAASDAVAVTPFSGALPPVAAASWGLDRIDQRNLPLDSLLSRPGTGAGVTAYIIDTGINASHTEFGVRVTSGYSVITDGRGSGDCNGHGTHVAGTVGGATYGVANGVSLVPVRVLDCAGSGWTSGVVAGINWMIEHHLAGVPAVANLSLGGGYSAVMNDAIARAVADGITVVVAAGNSNADACLTSPASAPSAITVAASTSTDYKAGYSNYGSCVDLFAPGSSITSAWYDSTTSTRTISGTSMASPHVAGAAATVLGNSRGLTPAQVSDRLRSDASPDKLSGVDSTTANLLLFLAGTASSSLNVFDGGGERVRSSRSTATVDEMTSAVPSPGDEPAVVAPPASPGTPAASPAPASPPVAESPSTVRPVPSAATAPARPRITRVVRVGRFWKVTVSAPKGKRVVLRMNGRVVARGSKKVFSVPVTRTKTARFSVS